MRIDLHVHTQKCKKGDGTKRNISPEDLVVKLSEQNVRICSITNHNKIDVAEYSKVAGLDPDLVIFPGVELDIDFHNERRHVVLVCNPKHLDVFSKTFDDEQGRDYDAFSLEYREFVKKVKSFGQEDIIVIPHFMDKERGFTIDEKDELFKDLDGYVVILETSKLRSMGVVNDHSNHLSLIGSDVKDWATYSKEVLPELKFAIDSFEKFFELANDAKNFVKNALEGASRSNIVIDHGAEIAIFDDINVIFGEKGSGKTILLKEHVYPQFCDAGKKVFLHEGKEYAKLYREMIQAHEDAVEIDRDMHDTIVSEFDRVISYNEPNSQDFIKKYVEYRQDTTKNKKSKRILKSSSTFSNNTTITVDFIVQEATSRIRKIDDVAKINAAVRKTPDSQTNKLNLDDQLHKLKLEIQLRAIKGHRELFIAQLTESFLEALKESLRKKAQKKSKPNNIGFSKLVAQRVARLESNTNIASALSNIQASQTKHIGHLPVKGPVSFETSVLTLTEQDIYKKDSIFDKSMIVLNRGLIKKLNHFSVKSFKDINQYFDSVEKTIKGEDFAGDVVKKASTIKITDNDSYIPSEGEKAILSISGLLESYAYECYLFDEVENGLGHKYISEYLIPRLKDLRSKGKTVVLSTHNANIAINTLPSQVIYCDYPSSNNYFAGNMYANELIGVVNGEILSWEDKAVLHLEGNKEMFNRRKNIYGL